MENYRTRVRAPLLQASPLSPYRGLVDERLEVHKQFALYAEGESGADGDFATVFGPESVETFFEAATRFYGDREFAVLVESETGEIMEQYLRDHGWELDEEEVAMVLAQNPDSPAPPPELTIRPVTNPQTYEDYMNVVPGNRDWIPSLDAATDPRVGLFVGYVEGTPVATSRLTCFPEVFEVLGVTTLEAWRRRGFGEAMTWAAIQEGWRRGCPVAVLTATEMGYPLYLRMGFQAVCTYRTYLPPDIR